MEGFQHLPRVLKTTLKLLKGLIVATVSEATMDFFLWYGNKKNL